MHALRDEIRAVLADAPVAQARQDRDPRPVHRALGSAGLLAPQWPVEYGGRGMSQFASAVLTEELAMHDVPDLLHTLTVQIVGNTLLTCGGEQIRARFLPSFAAGTAYACVLFSEPHAGSDLNLLSTRAVRDGDGYRIHGTKVHSMFARFADHGLCLARHADTDTLTLFMVPLAADGVTVRRVPGIADDDFHEIILDGVAVTDGDVVGGPGQGWAILVQTLAYERTGLDYYAKALRSYRAVVDRLDGPYDAVGLARLRARLGVAATMVRRVLTRLDRGELNEDEAAAAKWYTADLAADMAWWAGGFDGDLVVGEHHDGAAHPLNVALREAPGLRISGGTSEMMLETVARLRLDSGPEVRP